MKRKILSIILAVSIFCTTLATSVSAENYEMEDNLDIDLTQILNDVVIDENEIENDVELDEVTDSDVDLNDVIDSDVILDETIDGDYVLDESIEDEVSSNYIINFDSVDDVIIEVGSTINDIEFPSIIKANLSDDTTIDLDVTWELISDDEFSTDMQCVLVFSPVIKDVSYDIENIRIPNFSVIVISTKSTFNSTSTLSSDGPDVSIDDLDSYSMSFYNVWVTLPGIVGGQVKITGNLLAKFVGITEVEEGITIADIPNTVNGMELNTSAACFKGITSLKEVTVSPNNFGLTSSTFKDCVNLETVTFRNGVDQIPTDAFKGCTSLKTVNMTNTIELVKGEGFAYCTSLESIDLTGVTSLYQYAFSGCTNLKQVTLSNSLTSISSYAFYNCESLGSITIPNTVADIGTGAFGFCTSLTDIYFQGTEAEWNLVNVYNGAGIDLEQTTIHFLDGTSNGSTPSLENLGVDLGGLTINDDEQILIVIDIDGNLLEDVTVYDSSNKIHSTSTDGYLILGISNYSVTLKKDEYIDQLFPLDTDNQISIAVLHRKDDIYISSVKAELNNAFTELTYSYLYLMENNKSSFNPNSSLNITVTEKSDLEITKYELRQGDEVIVTSTTGEFEIPVYVDSNYSRYVDIFEYGETISLYVESSEGKNTTMRIGLTLNDAEIFENIPDDSSALSITNSFSFTVPDSVPIFAGSEFEFDGIKLPIYFDVKEDGRIRAGISIGDYLWEDNDSYDFFDACQIGFEKAIMSNVINGGESNLNLFEFSPKLKVIGYGEGNVDSEGNFVVNVGFILQLTAENTVYKTFYLWYLPIYGCVGYELDSKVDIQNASLSLKNKISTLDTSPAIYITPSFILGTGFGFYDNLSSGVEGKGTFEYTSNSDYAKIDAYVSSSTVFKLLGNSYKVNIKDSVAYTLWDSRNRLMQTMNLSNPNNSTYSFDNFTPISRDYLNSITTMNISDDPNISTFRGDGYDDPTPKLINVNGTAYMFWIEDAGYQRNTENRTALVYSKQNSDGSWSSSTQIFVESDASTADFNFEVTSNNNIISIALVKSNTPIESGSTLYDIAESVEIYSVVFDTQSDDITATRITTNNLPDMMANISPDGNYIAWAEYSSNDILDSQNISSIKYINVNSPTNISSIPVNGTLTSLALSNDTIAYIVDSDRNEETSEDRNVYFYSINSNETKLATTGANGGIRFTENSFYWYSNGDISSSLNGSTITNLFGEEVYSLSYQFMVFDSGSTIVWQSTSIDSLNTSNSIITMYAKQKLSDGSWSNTFKLIDTDSELTSDMSGYKDNDYYKIAYVSTNGETVSIKITDVTTPSDLRLNNVYYNDVLDVIPGDKLDLTLNITNTGANTINSTTISILEQEFTIDTSSLKTGETGDFNVAFLVPSELNDVTDFTATLGDDSDTSNNSYTFELGYTDLELFAERILVNDADVVAVNIKNQSNIDTDAVLKIYVDKNNNGDKELVFSKEIGRLTNDTIFSQLINISQIELEQGQRIDLFYFVVESVEATDIFEFNNSKLISLAIGREFIISDNNNNNNNNYDEEDEGKYDDYKNDSQVEPEENTPNYNPPTVSTFSGYNFSNSYSISSISTFSGFYIPEFKNVIANEYFALANVDMSSFEVSNGEFLGWYYDAEFTKPVELINDKYIILTDSIIQNGLYPKFAGKENVEEILDDAINGNSIHNNIIENTPVPSTQVKLLNRLF